MSDDSSVDTVLLDAPALFQITYSGPKHHSGLSGGVLLGPDPAVDNNAEPDEVRVTETFALPGFAFQGEGANLQSKDTLNFQRQMINKLKTVGADPYVQGWYLTGSPADLFTPAILENLYSYQKRNPNAIIIVHDASVSRQSGSLSLRAYRLSYKFIQMKELQSEAKTNKVSTDILVDLDMIYEDLVEELPVRVLNSHLVNLLTVSQELNSESTPEPTYDNLRVPPQSLMQENFDDIMSGIDDFNYEQSNYNYYQRQLSREKQKISQWQQRRKNENQVRESAGKEPLPVDEWKKLFKLPEEPSRLDNLLISAQLDEHCGQIEELGTLSAATLLSSRNNHR